MRTLDIAECAEFLKCERTHALKIAGDGTLPGAKIGRNWVFLEEDLVDYLRSEARKQMRERQAEATVKNGLEATAARISPVLVSPRSLAKKGQQAKRYDLSAFNGDGTPKLISEMV